MSVPSTPPHIRYVGDLSALPPHAHGHRSPTWWGMMGMILIEGTMFMLTMVTYFYLSNQVPRWPPDARTPELLYGTLFTVLTVASFIPNAWLKRVAQRETLIPVRIGLVVMSVVGTILLGVRYFEFPALNVAWSDHAYGSITVTLLGLHTVHLITDWVDTVVLTVLMFTRHGHGRRFVDCAENAIYWNFVVFAWLPIYALIYFYPRFHS